METGEYYLSELINCGEIMKAPWAAGTFLAGGSRIIVAISLSGTVKGTFTTLGKISVMLQKEQDTM